MRAITLSDADCSCPAYVTSKIPPSTTTLIMKQRFSSLDVKVCLNASLQRYPTDSPRSSRRNWPRSWSTSGYPTSMTCPQYAQPFPPSRTGLIDSAHLSIQTRQTGPSPSTHRRLRLPHSCDSVLPHSGHHALSLRYALPKIPEVPSGYKYHSDWNRSHYRFLLQ